MDGDRPERRERGVAAGSGADQRGPAPRDPAWRAAWAALAAAFLLHGTAVSWVWFAGGFGRGGVLAWVDFPASLAYMGLRGGGKLVWSWLLGGLQWGAVAALLSLLVGRSARPPAARGE
jgi:hypothetical protein